MTTQTLDHLDITEIEQSLQNVPPGQRPQKAFQQLGQQMQQSSNQSVQNWGKEIQQGSTQLGKACQQS